MREALIAVEPLDVARAERRLDELEVARLERLRARGVVGHEHELDAVDARTAAEIVGIGFEDDAVAAVPAHEAERPAADRLLHLGERVGA